MNASLLGAYILPAWLRARGMDTLEHYAELEKTQWLHRDALIEYQWKKLGDLLHHAWANVPFYRKAMEKRGITPSELVRARSLEILPIVHRAEIMKNSHELRARNIESERFVPNATGGSTGEPLRFFDDKKWMGCGNAAAFRSEKWIGAAIGDRRAYFWGANFEVSPFQGLTGTLRSWAVNRLMLPAWRLNESTASEFIRDLRRFRPKIVVAYAGAIYQWARLLRFERRDVPELAGIIVSAETLTDEWREGIEQTFGVPVYNRYGGRDIKFIAQECPLRKGLHVNAENTYIEIVNDGEAVPPGELGEIIVTRLDNWAMPFIRYRSGDLGVMSSSVCACGRGLPLLERVEGRVQDAILTADGRNVSGLFFPHLMKDCLEVREFQVHQLDADRLRILIVMEPGGLFSSKDRIERAIRDYMGNAMNVEFELTQEIPSSRTGKRRITVSHIIRSGDTVS